VSHPDDIAAQFRAQYVIAADGVNFSTGKLGVNIEDHTKLVDFVSTHFKADLSDYWDGKSTLDSLPT